MRLPGVPEEPPRLANRLLKRVRDFAQVKYDGVITKAVADFALDILDVDKLGLDNNDRAISECHDSEVFWRARWVLRRWQPASGRTPAPWRMCTSHTSS